MPDAAFDLPVTTERKTVTDAPSRQDSPENDDGRSSSEHTQGSPRQGAQGTQTQDKQAQDKQTQSTQTDGTPQWAADQPAPAPWFLGRPGPVPQDFPPPQTWPQPPAPPLPPPNADQANWPDQAPGARPEQPPAVPPWTGQAPPNPERPANAGPAGPAGDSPPQTPWLDPNRYGQQPGPNQPGHDQRSDHRQQQPQRREEPGKRPPLSLRTRWARGLALGGAACVLITLLNGYRNFPAWLIGAVIALLMSLGGLWLGAFAQRDAARQSQRAPEAVASVVWGGISTLIAVAIVAFSLVFYPQLRDLSNCMRAANTIAGQNQCQQQFDNSMTFKP